MPRTVLESDDIHELEQKLQKFPDDVDALVELGALRFEPGHEPSAAEELLRRAIVIDAKNVDALFWLAKVRFHDYCDVASAKRLLEEAISVDPYRADCLSLLASVLFDLDKEPGEYVQYIERAVQSEPDWPSLRHQYASTLMRIGRTRDAEMQAQKGIELLTIPKPPIGRESYYETAVTGRFSRYAEQELTRLNNELKRRRAREELGKSS